MALHPIEASALHARRERVYLVLAGVFLGTLTMLNIIGVTRFLTFGEVNLGGVDYPIAVAVGVLPYPITFLCTDFICELYGRKRANFLVWVGLLLNGWVLFILWLGGALPGPEVIDPTTGAVVRDAAGREPVFFEMRTLAFAATFASMAAYLLAQFTDVWMFHFWKRLTRGRHLWLRNNGSTLVSQAIDTVAVILITWWVGGLASVIDSDSEVVPQLLALIAAGYVFKFVVAVVDTVPFYYGTRWLSRYLEIDPDHEHRVLADPGMEDDP